MTPLHRGMTRPPFEAWAGDLVQPVPIAAAAMLAVNDHVLKGAGVLPGTVTGKLSDVAGLFVAGVLVVCLVRGGVGAATGRLPPRTGLASITGLITVAIAFAALKLWPGFNRAVAAVWGYNTLDPGDLYAVPMLALAALWLRDRDVRERQPHAAPAFRTGVAFALVLLLCAATSHSAPRPKPPRPVPGWIVTDGLLTLPCGQAAAWVSKSGKTGFGLTVRVVRNEDADCPATIASARLTLRDGTIVAGTAIDVDVMPKARPPAVSEELEPSPEPPSPALLNRARYHYVMFRFDNNACWNRGDCAGDVELEIDVGGRRMPWRMPGVHRYRDLSERS